ncbi:MAG: cytidylate kinase family protein [Clostridia bacterium]|nr:cytidylate kinase family protein [Clostridia bacterium]
MHISLAGRLGSGKSTLAKIFCPKYGFEHYYTGAIMRQLAEERGMSALEFNRMCENDRSADYMIDNKTTEVSRARRDDKILFDSRMAWHFAENSFKVYLYVPIEVSVKRIMGDSTRGNVEEYTDAADAEAKILARMQSESLRYREFYGVDNHDLNNYDLVLCTSAISPEEAADTIWREFNTYLEDPEGYPKPKKLYME